MSDPALAFAFATALIVSWVVTGWLTAYLPQRGVIDTPNARSSHTSPTPRGGGLGVLAGLAAGLIVGFLAGDGLVSPAFLLALAAVAAVGFWDDWAAGGLGAGRRLLLQAGAAALAIAVTGPFVALPLPPPMDVPLGALAWPLTILWVVAVLNIYNFLDGIDGFAGTQAVVAAAGLMLLPLPGPARLGAAALAAGSLGFLRYNWHPARIFMGDVGSTSIGFLLAALPLLAEVSERSAFVGAAALLLCFFLADGVFTLLRRLAHKEKIWEAHRSHLYQRLVASGLSHSQVCIRVGALMTLVATTTVVCFDRPGPIAWLPFMLAVLMFGLYWYAVTRRERNHGIDNRG